MFLSKICLKRTQLISVYGITDILTFGIYNPQPSTQRSCVVLTLLRQEL